MRLFLYTLNRTYILYRESDYMYTPHYSRIENLVRKIMLVHGIRTPDQLGADAVAHKLGLVVKRDSLGSARCGRVIFIKKGTPWEEWVSFCHELCHYFQHVGNQLTMHPLFRELQEYQAIHFARHFCVPSFMLERIRLPPAYADAIRLICTTFNVDPDFAAKRLTMHENKHFNRIMNY